MIKINGEEYNSVLEALQKRRIITVNKHSSRTFLLYDPKDPTFDIKLTTDMMVYLIWDLVDLVDTHFKQMKEQSPYMKRLFEKHGK